MRAKVNSSCVDSVVVGESVKEFRSKKFAKLAMCPLTSLISSATANSQFDIGNCYPRRILLSFLRLRLFGKQENFYPQSVESNSCHLTTSSAIMLPVNCNHSQVIPNFSGQYKEEKYRQNSTMQSQCNQCCNESAFGGMCNSCSNKSNALSSSSNKSSCKYCSVNFSQNDNCSISWQYHPNHPKFLSSTSLLNTGKMLESELVRNGNKCRSKDRSLSSSFSFLTNGLYSKFGMKMVLILLAILLICDSAVACGPGRGAGRRRAPRKLTPLVYKQHVPNVPENTLSASGFTEGRITRRDQKFKNLVPNYNQDIIFRDEEGTGADRLMTQRCKEKLNTLAISVMNQWPGVKLRVIEGWDEELHHATHSLHYEGRAVDITTSDKDRSKYGMLARLAVEAGFDWVYYESRAHIHCSVKSDSSQASRTGGCFSGNSTVETPSGPRKMADIQPGDKILSIDSNGKEVFSDVLMFLDRNASEVREFFEVTTESGTTLTLTPSHLLYSIQPEGVTPDDEFLLSKNRYLKSEETSRFFLQRAEITFAKFVQEGDWLLVKQMSQSNNKDVSAELLLNAVSSSLSSTYLPERVIKIEAKVETGVFAPLTSTGNLLVDGVLSSCYALIEDQSLAHLAFAPVRLAHNFRQSMSYLWNQFTRFITISTHANAVSPSKENVSSSSSSNAISKNQIEEKSSSSRQSPVKIHDHTTTTWRTRSVGDDNSIEQGIHWYASFLYSTTRYILPSNILYD